MRPAEEREVLELEGTVVHVGRGDVHTVECTAGTLRRTVLARRSGKLNQHHIKIVAGDRVRLEVSPYDMSRGRITFRL
jgi:translation initiation factor IF-1